MFRHAERRKRQYCEVFSRIGFDKVEVKDYGIGRILCSLDRSGSRVVVSYMGKNYFRNFLAPNPGICEVPGENHLGKIIFESDYIYPVLNDLEVSRNAI